MKKLLIALATTVALAGPALAEDYQCNDKFLEITLLGYDLDAALSESAQYSKAEQELGEKSKELPGLWQKYKDINEKMITLMQTYLTHKECNIVDRAKIHDRLWFRIDARNGY